MQKYYLGHNFVATGNNTQEVAEECDVKVDPNVSPAQHAIPIEELPERQRGHHTSEKAYYWSDEQEIILEVLLRRLVDSRI